MGVAGIERVDLRRRDGRTARTSLRICRCRMLGIGSVGAEAEQGSG